MPHRSKTSRRWLSVAAAVMILFVLSGTAQLVISYREHLRAIDRNLETLALTLIKQAEAEFRASEIALRYAASNMQERDHPDDWDSDAVFAMFKNVISTFNAAEDSASPHDLFWVDSGGRVRVTSYSNPTPEITARDRQYFQHHLSDNSPDVYYSGTLQSRLTSRWVIYQTVRINDRDGNFAGVVGITTRIGAFEVFYRQLRLEEGSSIIISHRQGGWSYRFPFRSEYTNIEFIGTPIFEHMIAARRGRVVMAASPYDGEQRRAGFYLGDSSQLLATVTLSQQAARREFYPALRQRGMMLLFVVLIMGGAIYFYDRAQRRSGEAMRLANIDELTQVPNRRSLDERLAQEWRRLQRSQQPLGLLYIDIDFFKKYNDHYGHEAGDKCLKQVAQIIQAALKRPDDFMGRYGGEEFIVLLPGNNYQKTGQMAHIIIEQIRAAAIPHETSPIASHLTVSIGYAAIVPRDEAGAARLKAMADKALYEAKHANRDNARGSQSHWSDPAANQSSA